MGMKSFWKGAGGVASLNQVGVLNGIRSKPKLSCVGNNFGVDDRRCEEGHDRGGVPTSDRVWGSAVSYPSAVLSGAPAAEGFACILCRQIASPSISVRAAYSL